MCKLMMKDLIKKQKNASFFFQGFILQKNSVKIVLTKKKKHKISLKVKIKA